VFLLLHVQFCREYLAKKKIKYIFGLWKSTHIHTFVYVDSPGMLSLKWSEISKTSITHIEKMKERREIKWDENQMGWKYENRHICNGFKIARMTTRFSLSFSHSSFGVNNGEKDSLNYLYRKQVGECLPHRCYIAEGLMMFKSLDKKSARM